MVSYIKSDLEFILEQIKIAEAHAAGQPLFGPGGLVPAYNLSMGLRTVDGTYNHLLPGQERVGRGRQPVPEPARSRLTGRQTARCSIRMVPGRRRQCRQRPTTIPRTIPTRSSSIRACARFPTCSSTRRWAIRQRSSRRWSAPARRTRWPILPLVTAIYQTFKPASDAEYQARVVMQNAKAAADALGDGDPRHRRRAEEQAAIDAWTAATAAHADDRGRLWKQRASCAMRRSSRSASPWTATTSIFPPSRRTRVFRRRSTPGSRCSASSSITASTSSTRAAAARSSFRCSRTIRCMSRAATPTSWC